MTGKRAGEDWLEEPRAPDGGWTEVGGGRLFALRAHARIPENRGSSAEARVPGRPRPSAQGAPREVRRTPGWLPELARARPRSELSLVTPGPQTPRNFAAQGR